MPRPLGLNAYDLGCENVGAAIGIIVANAFIIITAGEIAVMLPYGPNNDVAHIPTAGLLAVVGRSTQRGIMNCIAARGDGLGDTEALHIHAGL